MKRKQQLIPARQFLWLLTPIFFVISCKHDTITPDPKAVMEAPASARALEEVVFVNKSTYADTVIWSIDGINAQAAAVTAEGNLKCTFTAPGSHQLVLTAKREGKQNADTKSVIVDAAPTPVVDYDFTFINTQLLPQLKITDKSKFTTSRKWTVQEYPLQSTEQNPLLTFYGINKPYMLKLHAENSTTFQETVRQITMPDDSRHLAYYMFPSDNIVLDATGHGRNGMNAQLPAITTLPAGSTGVNGKFTAALFNKDAPNVMQLPAGMLTNAFADSKQVAISLWVKLKNPATPGVVLGLTDQGLNAWWPAIFYTGNKLYARLLGNNSNIPLPSVNTVTANTWYHIVLNADGVNNRTTFYLNGQLQGTLDAAINFAHLTVTWLGWCRTYTSPVIGGSVNDDYKYLDGNLAAVRLYKGVLSEQEVGVLYHEFD
jgi:PKD repeat protein